jgi:hypothetical protein
LEYQVRVTDATEAMVVPSQIDLTLESPVGQVAVIGMDDKAMDGAKSFDVVLTGTVHYRHKGGIAKQKIVSSRRIQFVNLDDDVAGIKVVQAPGEEGRLTYEALPYRTTRTAKFTVQLTSEPCCIGYCPCSDATDLGGILTPEAKVVVPVMSMQVSKAVPTIPVVNFNQYNWNIEHTVSFAGVDDKIADYEDRAIDIACTQNPSRIYDLQSCITDEPTKYNVLFGVCDSPTDSNFHAKHFEQFDNMGSVNDDEIGLNVSQVGTVTSEDGSTTSVVSISLLTEPKASLMITLVINRPDKAWASPPIFAFSRADWNIPQLSIITGFDDDVPDGDVPYTLSTEIIFSEDPDYGNGFIGMGTLTKVLDFVSIGEPDCSKMTATAEDFSNIKCDGPFAASVCQPGYRSARADGNGECIPCGIGYFNPLFNATSSRNCIPCPIGMSAKPSAAAVSATLLDACQLCIEGTYAPASGMVSCINCTGLGHPNTVFCPFGASYPLPVSTLHRQGGNIHEWGDVKVEHFSYYGRILPWETRQQMTMQEIQTRLFFLAFLPIIFIAWPIMLLSLLHVLQKLMRQNPQYAEWERQKFNKMNGHWVGKKKKRAYAATKIQAFARARILDKGAYDKLWDLKTIMAARKVARRWRQRAKELGKERREAETAAPDRSMKRKMSKRDSLSQAYKSGLTGAEFARDARHHLAEELKRRPKKAMTFFKKWSGLLKNRVTRLDQTHIPDERDIKRAIVLKDPKHLDKRTFVGGVFQLGYLLTFGSLASIFVYVSLSYNMLVSSSLVPKDDAMRLSVVTSDFNVSLSFHGLTIDPEWCSALETMDTPNAVLTTNGITTRETERLKAICEPGNTTIAWSCLGCAMSGDAILDVRLNQPLKPGKHFGLVDHTLSTLGDTDTIPNALTILQATQIDWCVTASPCVRQLPIGGESENNTVRGTFRYDHDGTEMAWYQPKPLVLPSATSTTSTTSATSRLLSNSSDDTVAARLFRGETAEVVVSATPSLYWNELNGEETKSFRLQWLSDMPASGQTQAAFLSPDVPNSLRFKLVLQGTNQMLNTQIRLQNTYLGLLAAVGGLSVAVFAMIYGLVKLIDMVGHGTSLFIDRHAALTIKGTKNIPTSTTFKKTMSQVQRRTSVDASKAKRRFTKMQLEQVEQVVSISADETWSVIASSPPDIENIANAASSLDADEAAEVLAFSTPLPWNDFSKIDEMHAVTSAHAAEPVPLSRGELGTTPELERTSELRHVQSWVHERVNPTQQVHMRTPNLRAPSPPGPPEGSTKFTFRTYAEDIDMGASPPDPPTFSETSDLFSFAADRIDNFSGIEEGNFGAAKAAVSAEALIGSGLHERLQQPSPVSSGVVDSRIDDLL